MSDKIGDILLGGRKRRLEGRLYVLDGIISEMQRDKERNEMERIEIKKKQEKIRELKKKCNKDEHGHTLYLSTITQQTKVATYKYKSRKTPVGFYCPICNELYNLKCKKCEH